MSFARPLTWLLAIFLLAAAGAFAFEIGANLDNATGFLYEVDGNPTLTQTDKLALCLQIGFSDYLKLASQGSAMFTIEDPYFYFDLDYLIFEGDFPKLTGEFGVFRFDVGRIGIADFTRNVVNHKVDAVKLELGLPFAVFSASIGYTGFLFKHSSNIFMSRADENDQADDGKYFAPPRLVGTVGIRLPELFLRQTIDLAFIYQFDLRDQYSIISEGATALAATGGHVTSQYSGVGISGPIVHPYYWDSFFYLNTGQSLSYMEDTTSSSGYSYNYQMILAYLFGVNIRFYMPELLYSMMELKFLFASGDADYETYFLEGNTSGNAGTFVAISNPGFGMVFSPKLGNLFRFDVSYSIKPFSKTDSLVMQNLQAVIKGIFFFRPTLGKISEAFVNPDSHVPFLGAEIDAILNFRPASDVGMALKYGIFLPNAGAKGAFLQDVKKIEMLGKFELSLGF